MTLEIDQIRTYFRNELDNERFTTDRNGGKTIELIGASFYADEPAIFGTPNQDYIDAELAWYESQSTNINDIYVDRDPPKAWEMSANRHGEINSNYGHLIFSDKYHNQFDQVVRELRRNKDSRRASMVYQRPSIWVHSVVQMRSNDVIFGYRNDYAWQEYVLYALADELSVDTGTIHWQVQNLHVYERHFDLVKQMG